MQKNVKIDGGICKMIINCILFVAILAVFVAFHYQFNEQMKSMDEKKPVKLKFNWKTYFIWNRLIFNKSMVMPSKRMWTFNSTFKYIFIDWKKGWRRGDWKCQAYNCNKCSWIFSDLTIVCSLVVFSVWLGLAFRTHAHIQRPQISTHFITQSILHKH